MTRAARALWGVVGYEQARTKSAAQPQGGGPVRPGLARALFDRRVDLPDRAGGRRDPARRGRPGARRRRGARCQGGDPAARRRHVAVRPDGGRGAGHRLFEVPPRGGGLRQGQAAGDGPARHRARPSQCLAEAARALVSRRRLDLGAMHLGRHGRQQFLRFALDPLRQHGAQRRLDRRAAGERPARPLRFDAARGHARGCARHRGQGGGAGLRRTRRDRTHVPARAAPGRRLQSRHLLSAVGAALHDRQFGEPRAPAGGQRGHAGGDGAPHAQPGASPEAQDAGRRELPEFLQRDGQRPAHRQAEAGRRGTGRPHDDRAGARQSRLPAGDRAGADRPARGHPAGRVRGRGARGPAARPDAARRADGRSRHAGQCRGDAGAQAAVGAVGSPQGRPQHHDVDEGRR